MVSAHALFAASAGIAGALIGLRLFSTIAKRRREGELGGSGV